MREVFAVKGDYDLEEEFSDKVTKVLAGIQVMLEEKNRSYGDSALNPESVFSNLNAEERLAVRIDDKLNRIKKGSEYADEDTLTDLIGYLVLLKIARGENE